MTGDLTPSEVARAVKRGIFTVTSETERGYYVTVFRSNGGAEPVRIAQSKECVRPRTARRHGARLVRSALSLTRGAS